MSRTLCALSLIVLTGCTLVPRRYAPVPAAQPRYYVASFEIERETQGAALAQRAESLARDAAAVLQIGRRVAFFPPDTCLDTAATPSSERKPIRTWGHPLQTSIAAMKLS